MTMLRRRQWLRALGGLSLGLGLLAFCTCNTPFIPIPPPGDPTFTPVNTVDGMGAAKVLWETRGQPQERQALGKVYIFNANTSSGVIARANTDGSYVAAPLDGQRGDRIELYYETPQGEASPVICRSLEEGLARSACP